MKTSNDQAAIMAEILEQHERQPHSGLKDAARLRLHVSLHVVAETQIRDGHPPATAETLKRLMAEGLSRHEAIHAICSVVAQEMTEVMGDRRSFDESRFAGRLRALSAADWQREAGSS